MLRITVTDNHDKLTLKLEGRLVEGWVQELWTVLLRTELQHRRFEVDIRDLSFADEEGEQALLWLYKMGAKFLGGGSFSEFLCNRLGIPRSQRKEVSRR